MADKTTAPDSGRETAGAARGSRGSPPGTPRWVKVSGVVAIVLLLLFVALHAAGLGLGGHMHHLQ